MFTNERLRAAATCVGCIALLVVCIISVVLSFQMSKMMMPLFHPQVHSGTLTIANFTVTHTDRRCWNDTCCSGGACWKCVKCVEPTDTTKITGVVCIEHNKCREWNDPSFPSTDAAGWGEGTVHSVTVVIRKSRWQVYLSWGAPHTRPDGGDRMICWMILLLGLGTIAIICGVIIVLSVDCLMDMKRATVTQFLRKQHRFDGIENKALVTDV